LFLEASGILRNGYKSRLFFSNIPRIKCKLEYSFVPERKKMEFNKNARMKAYSAVNFAMVEAYWNIGKNIVD